MTERRFSRPREGLERDHLGYRTGFKIYIKVKKRMARESFLRWGHRQRQYIFKHPYVWTYYGSSRAIGLPNGIPVSVMANNRLMGEYLVNNFLLQDGEVYALHGWTNGKTKYHCKLTKILAIIEVHNAEKNSFTVKNDGRLARYFFRSKKRELQHKT